MNQPFDQQFDALPPELQVAPREFDSWSQAQLLKEQCDSTPESPLYHYTDENGLIGILSDEKLWCFCHQDQKDQEEFAFSLEIAKRVVKEVGDCDDGPTRHFCACLLNVVNNNSFDKTFEFYIFSLSRHEDDPRQWLEYGRQGQGYAIGFAPSLFAATDTTLNIQANENLHVGRVIYGEAATEARHRLVVETAASITSKVAWANRSLDDNAVSPNSYFLSMVREVIASQLVWNCLTAKHERFANESEVRFIIMNVAGNFDTHRKVFARGTERKTYIEAPLTLKVPGNIAQILVGPHAPFDAEKKLANRLGALGYPVGFPIRRSSAFVEMSSKESRP